MVYDNRSGDPAEITYEEEEDPSIWTTRDGTEIPITGMSDQHLSNARKHLTRKMKIPQEKAALEDILQKVGRLEAEQERRKE